jgi:hypothetical protein
MSYTYLQEQGEASSAECFSDIPAYVLSRLNLIAEKSCCNASGTASCPSSQFGTMCEPLTENRGGESLMSCAEDSHVKIFQRQETGQALTENEAGYGPQCPGSLARFDPVSRSWKTRQCLLAGGLEEFSETWPRWGMMQDGECFRLPMLEHDTSVRGCGLWPTPLKDCSTSQNYGKPSVYCKARSSFGLNQVANCWEFLMGWPVGWTKDDQPLATDKFQQWLNLHGKC